MQIMKSKYYLTIFMMAGALATAQAQTETASGVSAKNISVERNGNLMSVDMTVDVSALKVDANRAIIITPCLQGEGESADMKSIGIYGRRRYYYYQRNNQGNITGDSEMSYRAKSCPDEIAYHADIPYADWQSGAQLTLKQQTYGCCSDILAENAANLGEFYHEDKTPVLPQLVYRKADAQLHKEYSISGSAYIHFPVNQTVIYDTYLDNQREIGKIRSLIDSIKAEKDINIASITLKGYASPEGSYANNTALAAGRTEALKSYITKLYKFDSKVMKAESEPEDWDGLRRYVESSALTNKDGILNIINSDREADAKELEIRKQYPAEYATLLRDCYPRLRHTDYTISCDVRRFYDPAEIKDILKRRPGMLSLNEIYILADTYEPGSEDYNEIYETAVRLFPDDEVANLNVANNALRSGDLNKANKYLEKAGTSAEAIYARGVAAYMAGDNDTAKTLLNQAKQAGISAADEVLSKL